MLTSDILMIVVTDTLMTAYCLQKPRTATLELALDQSGHVNTVESSIGVKY